jgi:hypothetical protein
MCWEVCVLLMESGEFCHFLWKRRTCLAHFWHSAPLFFMFESKKVLGSAEPRLRLHFVFCRTKTAFSVSLLQNQVCVFSSFLAEPRLRLNFGSCRTKTSSVRPLQNQGYCFISFPAEPRQCLYFVFCRTNTTSSVCLLQNQDCVFSLFSSFYIHQSRESFLRNVNSLAIRKDPRTLWRAKFYHRVQKSPPRVCILSQTNSVHITPSATVLFPCGVGRLASRLFSKLVGLYHKVIYVGGL